MKLLRKYFVTAGLILLGTATFANASECAVEPGSLQVEWTAFKTTQKLPVAGSFQRVNLIGKNQASSLAKLLADLSVMVESNSVDTKNPGRDETLREFFFQKLVGDIKGQLQHYDAAKKMVELKLQLNGKTAVVPLQVERNAGDFVLKGELDLGQFAAQSALASLNKKCFDLHKGPDGISKTWESVALVIRGKLQGECK